MYSLMRFWNLIEPAEHKDFEDDKKASGFWRVTQKGIFFVTAKIQIPKYVYLFNNQKYSESWDTIDIKDALGKKFSYTELMK